VTAYHPSMTVTGRAAAAATTGLLVAGVLAGCGSSSSTVAQDPGGSASNPSSPTTSQSTPDGPACTKVWKAGASLPSPYLGCTAATGWVKAQVYQCSDGHRVVTYAHTYYTVVGRTISRAATTLASDHGFRHTMAACGA
jgi:hypothetical protein